MITPGNHFSNLMFMDGYGWVSSPSNELFDKKKVEDITIALTDSFLDISEIKGMIKSGDLDIDGEIINHDGCVKVTKISIQPVWDIKSICDYYSVTEENYLSKLFKYTGLESESFLKKRVFIPSVPANTLYVVTKKPISIGSLHSLDILRVHDECNSSDVFGSTMCSCRPFLIEGIVKSIKSAQSGGNAAILYMRHEGRAMGEVSKFLIYNQRKYFYKNKVTDYFGSAVDITNHSDIRNQDIAAEILYWAGVKVVKNFVSMSPHKTKALGDKNIIIENTGVNYQEIIPKESNIEIEAKILAGYK